MPLPSSAVTEDRRLETTVESASESLAQHRWHWTLDESNPERVSIREYARETARGYQTIRKYAQGYAIFREHDIVLTEAMERAQMGSETEAATEAVAQARDLSVSHTRQSRPTEVRRVREIARERAEKRGTSVEEEASQVADYIVKAERAGDQLRSARQERLGLRYIEMERKLSSVKRFLVEAVNLAHDIDWGEEEKELLQDSLRT